MYQTLRYEKQENIAILTINRPEALNALNSTVIGDLEQAITEVEKDADTEAGVVFLDSLVCLERIYDHARNIAEEVLAE